MIDTAIPGAWLEHTTCYVSIKKYDIACKPYTMINKNKMLLFGFIKNFDILTTLWSNQNPVIWFGSFSRRLYVPKD